MSQKEGKVCPDGRLLKRPYSVWCSTDPSVIRGCRNYIHIIPWGKKHVKSQKANFCRDFAGAACVCCQNSASLFHPAGNGKEKHPNIFILSSFSPLVNRKNGIAPNFRILYGRKLDSLYTIPYCIFLRTWYSKSTKGMTNPIGNPWFRSSRFGI